MSARAKKRFLLTDLGYDVTHAWMAFSQRACEYTSSALPDSVVPPLQGQWLGVHGVV